MDTSTGKRTARVRRTLTKRTVDALQPAEKPWIAWDDKLTGFGVRIQPSGTKAFIVNYRAGDGGRKAPTKRVVLGRYGPLTADKARKLTHEVLGKVAGGDDPAGDRAEARGMPTLGDVFELYMAANPNRSKRTNDLYRYEANRHRRLCGRLDHRAASRARSENRRSDRGADARHITCHTLCAAHRPLVRSSGPPWQHGRYFAIPQRLRPEQPEAPYRIAKDDLLDKAVQDIVAGKIR